VHELWLRRGSCLRRCEFQEKKEKTPRVEICLYATVSSWSCENHVSICMHPHFVHSWHMQSLKSAFSVPQVHMQTTLMHPCRGRHTFDQVYNGRCEPKKKICGKKWGFVVRKMANRSPTAARYAERRPRPSSAAGRRLRLPGDADSQVSDVATPVARRVPRL
jgi:hypothetical protein